MTLDYVSVACQRMKSNTFNTVEPMLELMLMDISVVIDADRDEDDTEIYLSVKGENFTFVIDISAMENSSNNRVIKTFG